MYLLVDIFKQPGFFSASQSSNSEISRTMCYLLHIMVGYNCNHIYLERRQKVCSRVPFILSHVDSFRPELGRMPSPGLCYQCLS